MDFKFLIIFFVAVLTSGISALGDAGTTSAPTTTTDTPSKSTTEIPASTTLSSAGTTTVTSPDGSTETTNVPASNLPTETTTATGTETTTVTQASTTLTPTETTTTQSSTETTTENSQESTTNDPTTTSTTPSFADDVNTATQNLLGVNCMVQAIYNVEDLVPNFQYEIESCGSKAQTEAASTLKKVNNLQTKCSKVVKVNDKTCKNANFNQNSDAAKTPTDKCINDIKKAMDELNESVATTIDNVEKYYKKTTNSCARMAFLKFKLTLNNFSAIIKACAKISSNVK